MDYPKTKVYFDSGHYIGIPHSTQGWKKRRYNSKPNETEAQVASRKGWKYIGVLEKVQS